MLGGGSIGKILLLSFGDDEDEMINSVLSALEVGRRTYKIEETKILQSACRFTLRTLPERSNEKVNSN